MTIMCLILVALIYSSLYQGTCWDALFSFRGRFGDVLGMFETGIGVAFGSTLFSYGPETTFVLEHGYVQVLYTILFLKAID